MSHVLFATDGSGAARIAEELLATIPWPAPTSFCVLTVVPSSSGPEATTWPVASATVRAQELNHLAAAEADLAGTAERLRLQFGSRAVAWALVRGRASDEIVAIAQHQSADLIVVGSRGLNAIEGALLGSVAAAVADRAPCPVLIARTPRLGRSIVADDGSAGASRAIAYVCDRPWLLGDSARLLTVLSDHDRWADCVDLPIDPVAAQRLADDQTELMLAAEDRLQDRRSQLRGAGSAVALDTEIARGRPGSAIVDTAHATGADLVVVGSRRRAGHARLAFGSVGRHVLNQAGCNVLLVGCLPTPARPRPADSRVPLAV